MDQSGREAIRSAFGKPPEDLKEADIVNALGRPHARENGFLEFKSFPEDPTLSDPRSLEEHIVAPIIAFLNKPFAKAGALVLGISDSGRGAKRGIPAKIIPLKLSEEEFDGLHKRLLELLRFRPRYKGAFKISYRLGTNSVPVKGGLVGIITCGTQLPAVFYSVASDRVFIRNWDNNTELSAPEIEQLVSLRSQPYLKLTNPGTPTLRPPSTSESAFQDYEVDVGVTNVGARVTKDVLVMLTARPVNGEIQNCYAYPWEDITAINVGSFRVFQTRIPIVHPVSVSSNLGKITVSTGKEAGIEFDVKFHCDEGEFGQIIALTIEKGIPKITHKDPFARFYHEE